MGLQLQARLAPDRLRLSGRQVRLVLAALAASGAGDLDLLVPGGYVPSTVAEPWSNALLDAVPDLVLVSVWSAERAQLRPATVRRLPPAVPVTERGRHRRPALLPDGRPVAGVAAAFAGVPPLAEHTPVLQTPLGPLLQSLALWVGTSGGFQVA